MPYFKRWALDLDAEASCWRNTTGSVDGSLANFGVRGRVIVRGAFSISSDENAEKRREKRVKRQRRRKEGEGEEAMAV